MPKMATTYSSGGQSPTSLSRTIDRVIDDAQHTGDLNLSGRKLKEFPLSVASKYDLVDTISADLSKNRLGEVPKEVCDYSLMEKLNCYHNVIKVLPEALVQLQALTHLNLSRNQLSIIPPFISQLQALEVLIASHNKLVSLPEEIGVLERLMEIDVSCNEISHLPPQVGELKSLRSLDVRRNLLIELPVEISKLNLRKLNFSSNKISKIPTVFRKIETLEEIVLDNNPLTQPPAHVCTKGKQHIMKYLKIEAIREERKRGVLNEAEMKRLVRKSLPPQQSVISDEFRNIMDSPENKQWKRHTVLSSDSGYSTTDSLEKCGWSPSEATNGDIHMEDASRLSIQAAEAVREQRNVRNFRDPADQYRQRPPSSPYMGHYDSRQNDPRKVPQEIRTQLQDTRTSYPQDPRGQDPRKHNMDYKQYSPSSDPRPYPQDSRQYSPHESRQYSPVDRQSPAKLSVDTRSPPPRPDHRMPPPPPITLATDPSYTNQSPALTPKTPTPDMYQYSSVQSPPVNSPNSLSNSSFPMSPQLTPETPVAPEKEGFDDDAFSRELQRQKSDYERKKKQAEQLRLRQEEQLRQHEDEKEQRRKAALRVHEEQRAVLEREREDDFRHREEQRLREEAQHREEMQRLDEARLQEEQRQRDEAILQEELRQKEEARLREEQKQKEESQQYKAENKKPVQSSSKETNKDTKKSNYRRTVSDSTAKKSQPSIPAHNSAPGRVKNGPASQRTQSTTSMISPSPSPRSSIGSGGPSPASSTSSINKAGGDKQGPGSVNRRTKIADKVAASTGPTRTSGNPGRTSTSTMPITSNPNRLSNKPATITSTNAARKNHLTPEEEFRQKHQSLKTIPNSTDPQRAKSRIEDPSRLKHSQREAVNNFVSKRQNSNSFDDDKKRTIPPRTNFSTSVPNRRPGALSSSTMKVIDSYKDADPNFTIRRQIEQQREDIEQLEQLRRIIETKLKVTLPENLPDVLRDGVLLCQLANSIRPRSVTSIHVPSPAVPKLTLAKCRKNVENFLEACRKIGVTRDQICGPQDILEEKGICRVANTISALVAITNPRSSNV